MGRGQFALVALAVLAACNPRPDTGPVIASVIGAAPGYADPARGPLPEPARVLIDATAQGLVRFDAAGQIEAGLAERWTVIDGGMTYIFRLRAAEWGDGRPVEAEEVAAILRRQVAPGSRNPLAPVLTAVGDVVVMTPEVIEVQLKRPRPDLLKLFAQPELAILRARPRSGSGPFRIREGGTAPLLRPAIDRARADPDDAPTPSPAEDVRLIGERAARAIARFALHRSDLVIGGRFADWPLLDVAGVAPANVRADPAAGLFGLAVTSRAGFLAEPGNRTALAEAIDRAAVLGAVLPAWTPAETILPDTLDSASAPATPAWTTLSLADRRAEARARIAAWTGGPIAPLRIALPAGPGATLLFAGLSASLGAVGLAAERVAPGAAADLALVDQVAPYDSARWYLAEACRLCSEAATNALAAARDAPTLPERAARIGAADEALGEDVPFIPLARPLRWSLVALRLRQWQPNTRAIHPLNRLRPVTN